MAHDGCPEGTSRCKLGHPQDTDLIHSSILLIIHSHRRGTVLDSIPCLGTRGNRQAKLSGELTVDMDVLLGLCKFLRSGWAMS